MSPWWISDGIQRADFGEGGEFVFAEFGDAAGEVVNRLERREAAFADESMGGGFAESANVFESEAEREFGGMGGGWFLAPLRGWDGFVG